VALHVHALRSSMAANVASAPPKLCPARRQVRVGSFRLKHSSRSSSVSTATQADHALQQLFHGSSFDAGAGCMSSVATPVMYRCTARPSSRSASTISFTRDTTLKLRPFACQVFRKPWWT